MRVLKGTLTFVLGIIMGIVLFVGAIAGTIYAVATSFTIGDITEKVGLTGDKAIFDEGSEVTNKTIWEVGQDLIGDVQNIGNMTLNEIAEKYGLTKKVGSFGEISGIDISALFDVPINQLKDNLGLVVDGITLQDIGEFAQMDFSQYGLPVLDDNLNNPVKVALDAILKSIDGDNISLRLIEDNFGITLGENAIFNQIKDTPLSSFGDVINGLKVGAIIDADCDQFVKVGENVLYVKTERYEVVPSNEYNTVKDGAATYVYGYEDGALLERELRFVQKTTKDSDGNTVPVLDEFGNPIYRVDTSCYNQEFDTEKTFYRFYEYEVYDPATMPVVGELYVRVYGNHLVKVGEDFVPVEDGYILLNNLSNSTSGNLPTITGNTVNLTTPHSNLLTAGVWEEAERYGLNTGYEITKDSRLESGFDGYARVKIGSSDVAIQAIAYTTVNGLNNATDTLMSLKLGDLIEIDDESSQILQTLKNKPLNKLSDSIDDLVLGDVIDITFSLYKESATGDYVRVETSTGDFYYTLYNPNDHTDYYRYTKVTTGDSVLPDYVLATETDLNDHTIMKYYWDGTQMVAGNPAGEQLYVKGNASSKILQRLASISIGDFSNSFDDLVLGDVIDVDMDNYEVVPAGFDFESSLEEFYYFDENMYRVCSESAHFAGTVYRVVEESESSAILKKLALVKVNELSSVMNTLIDDMRLDEVMTIDPVLYMPHTEGAYVYVKAGGYYTLYNPAVHEDSQRFVRVTMGDNTFRLATEDEIADSTLTKYFWNETEKRMQTTGTGDQYVEVSYSSLMLQRFARVKINGFSNALDTLALSDVMDIDADVYEKVADTSDPNRTYYYYNDGLYIQADAEYITTHPTDDYYAVASYGTSHIVMKKMAYLAVTDLGNRMEDVINDLYLEDLLDIYEFDVIADEPAGYGTAGTYFIPYDEDYTEYVGDDAHRYAFLRDVNGKYYLRNSMYFALDDTQADAFKDGANTVSFDYRQLTDSPADRIEFGTLIATQGNGYFKDSLGNYHHNPALCAYILATADTANYASVYVRVTGTSVTAPKYDNSTGRLYVNVLGGYEQYDPANPVHADLDKYLILDSGYALVKSNPNDTREKFYFHGGVMGGYFDTTSTGAYDIVIIKNEVKATIDSVDYYYYAPLDSEYNQSRALGILLPTFSKQLAESTYVATNKASATKAFFDKHIIDVDAVPEDAADVIYIKEEIGYVAVINGDSSAVNAYLALMDASTRKVAYVQEQSAAALKAFAVHNVKVSSLDTSLKDFTISDMMNIAPDSLFDDEEIKTATIDDLGTVFQTKLQNMTIQNILDWGNITTLSPEVLAIIGEATLEDFFASLSYSNGSIHVNIVTLYKNIYARQNGLA